jgi:hypothetical protein
LACACVLAASDRAQPSSRANPFGANPLACVCARVQCDWLLATGAGRSAWSSTSPAPPRSAKTASAKPACATGTARTL